MHAQHNSTVVSAPGRARAAELLHARLLAEIDTHEPGLSEPERQRRLIYARKAHYARLALASAKSRRQRAGQK